MNTLVLKFLIALSPSIFFFFFARFLTIIFQYPFLSHVIYPVLNKENEDIKSSDKNHYINTSKTFIVRYKILLNMLHAII